MGTRYNHISEAVLTYTHNLCFEQKYEKYQNYSTENFQSCFTAEKNRCILHGQSIIMTMSQVSGSALNRQCLTDGTKKSKDFFFWSVNFSVSISVYKNGNRKPKVSHYLHFHSLLKI